MPTDRGAAWAALRHMLWGCSLSWLCYSVNLNGIYVSSWSFSLAVWQRVGHVGIGQQPFAFPEEPCVCAGRGRGELPK